MYTALRCDLGVHLTRACSGTGRLFEHGLEDPKEKKQSGNRDGKLIEKMGNSDRIYVRCPGQC